MDRESIATALAKDLDRALVKPPPRGKFGDFVPAFDIFTTANRIFGPLGWSDRIVGDVEVVWSGEVTVEKDRKPVEQFRATVRATVEVTIFADDGGAAHHVGVGYGHGFSTPNNPGDAIESAGKEAETDATKRALRKFGNPLGLALYDPTKAHVSDNPDAAEEREAAKSEITDDQVADVKEKIGDIWDLAVLKAFWNGLAEYQPGMQSMAGVAAVKDDQIKRIKENAE